MTPSPEQVAAANALLDRATTTDYFRLRECAESTDACFKRLHRWAQRYPERVIRAFQENSHA